MFPELLQEVFNTPEGFVTNPVAYGENTTLIAEVRKVSEPYTPPLDEIRVEVTERYMVETTQTAVQSFAEGLIERVNTGDISFAEAAEAANRTLIAPNPTGFPGKLRCRPPSIGGDSPSSPRWKATPSLYQAHRRERSRWSALMPLRPRRKKRLSSSPTPNRPALSVRSNLM